MKPLLCPARDLKPGMLEDLFGLSASTFQWQDRQTFDRSREEILEFLQTFVSSPKIKVETEDDDGPGKRFRGVYEFTTEEKVLGFHRSVSIGYMPEKRQKGFLHVSIPWSSLPADREKIVDAVDHIWRMGPFDSLYVYDNLDHTIQNERMLGAMDFYGLDRSQVEVIKLHLMDQIDTSHNPGYWENRDGTFVSMQWLSYWSPAVQQELFGGRPLKVPQGVELVELGSGDIRVRLAKLPGKYNDIQYHQLQLDTRRELGLPM